MDREQNGTTAAADEVLNKSEHAAPIARDVLGSALGGVVDVVVGSTALVDPRADRAELDQRAAELDQRAAALAADIAQFKADLRAVQHSPVAVHLDSGAGAGELREEHECEEVPLEASVWGNALLSGVVPGEGAGSTALLVALLLINTAIQATFCFIVKEALSTPAITEQTVVQYRVWRRNVAHDFKFYNAASQKSLAQRVCENDAGLEMSGEQASVAYNLFQYLGDGDGQDMSAVGTLMASLALLCFSLSVWRELHAVASMSRAVCAIPRGIGTQCSVRDGALTYDSLGFTRLCVVLAVYAARTALVIYLLIYGSLFLVYTIPLGDLLLNAVALEFVINVDEVLFDILAPSRVRRLVKAAPPLRVRTTKRVLAVTDGNRTPGESGGAGRSRGSRKVGVGTNAGLDIATLGTLVLALAWVLGVYVSVMKPQLGTLVRARDALCAGDQYFIFTVDGMGAVAWSYPGNYRAQFNKTTMPSRNFPLGHNHAQDIPYADLTYMPIMDRRYAGDTTYAMHVVDVLLQSYGRYTAEDCLLCEYKPAGAVHPEPNPARPACCLAQKTFANQVAAGRFSLRTRSMDDTVSANELWNPTCGDALFPDGMAAQYVDVIRGAMSDAAPRFACGGSCPALKPFCSMSGPGVGECIAAPTCADVAQWCNANNVTGVRARQLCPDTCGCNKPRHPLALSLPQSGCGATCLKAGDYAQRLRELPCEDVPKDNALFRAYLDDVLNVQKSFPNDWRAVSDIAQALQRFGCEYLTRAGELVANKSAVFSPFVYGINMCTETGKYFPIKPLSYYCPVACGCRAGDPHCPASCPARNESDMSVGALCPEHMRDSGARPIAAKYFATLRGRTANVPDKYRCPQLNKPYP